MDNNNNWFNNSKKKEFKKDVTGVHTCKLTIIET